MNHYLAQPRPSLPAASRAGVTAWTTADDDMAKMAERVRQFTGKITLVVIIPAKSDGRGNGLSGNSPSVRVFRLWPISLAQGWPES